MKNRNIYLYLAGACFFAMCGSLWNEFVASDKSVNPSVRKSVDPSFRDSVNPNIRGSKARYYAVPKAAVESFPFDPNEADSTQLLRLGLTPAQVRSIYRHRAKGYVYSRVEDFARTPFMTRGQWDHLRPLIKIGDQYKPVKIDSMFNVQGSTSRLSEGRPKLASGLPSDSDVCGEQPRIVNCQLSIINLNDASFKELVRHPFLSYEQVKAVKNFQRKYGRIRNMTELLILPEFTVEDTVRLSPYLQF